MKRILLLVLLSACAAPAPISTSRPVAGSYPNGLENTCDGERYGPLVGQDATALERVLILGEVRLIRPGTISTQDYRPHRINFDIDANNTISQIRCG